MKDVAYSFKWLIHLFDEKINKNEVKEMLNI